MTINQTNTKSVIAYSMNPYPAIDAEGSHLTIGDWVRVIAVPLSIRETNTECLDAFSNAVGHTFQIEQFDELGCLQLDLYPKISCATIYLEPYCVRRFRRYKKQTKAFQRKLRILNAPQVQRLAVQFDAHLKDGANLEAVATELVSLGTMGGFSVWTQQQRIQGTIEVEASDPAAKETLKTAVVKVKNHAAIESVNVSDLQDAP